MNRTIVGVTVAILGWAAAATPAQDPAPRLAKGMTFEGTYNRVELLPGQKAPHELNTDAKLTVTDVTGKAWEGDLWLLKGSLGMKVKGAVEPGGGVTLQFVKETQGKWRRDLIGKARGGGRVEGGKLNLKVLIPGENFEAVLRAERKEPK